MGADFIPDDQFTPDPVAPNQQHGASADFIPDEDFDKGETTPGPYDSLGQQALTVGESLAKGFLGPVASLIQNNETARGVANMAIPAPLRAITDQYQPTPEDIRGREEANPVLSGLGEAAGFGAGLFSGVGEAALLEKAAAPVAGLVQRAITGGVAKSSLEHIGARLAAGAAKSAAEMALFQSGDEASKAILQDPNQTVGSAATNVGLSTLLGGGFGGAFTGLGMAAGGVKNSVADSKFLKDFRERLAYRGSDLSSHEMIEKEFHDAMEAYHGMNDELTGPQGLQAKAFGMLMPEMNRGIEMQAKEAATSLESRIAHMRRSPSKYPERLVSKLEDQVNEFKDKAFPKVQKSGPIEELSPAIPKVAQDEVWVTPIRFDQNPAREAFPWLRTEDAPPTLVRGEEQLIQHKMMNPNPTKAVRVTPVETVAPSPGRVFNAINDLKKELQGYSKGNYGPFAIPAHHEAYDFLNATKALGYDFRNMLEDQTVWGKVAEVQKQINSSWHKVLPAVKDAQKKFMEKVGGEYVPSPQKFTTYLNQNGKSTSESIRQKMMGNFTEAMEKHFDAVDEIYRHAGIDNPFPRPSMNALQASLNQSSTGSRVADLWFDRMGSRALGDAAGAAAGISILPGIEGAYLGKEILGPMFGSVIQPIMEKGVNARAVNSSMSYMKAAIKGDHELTNAATSLFTSGMKTVPSKLMPDPASLDKLDQQLKDVSQNPFSMMKGSEEVADYFPGHGQALSQSLMQATNYLNSQRPVPVKAGILDPELPISKDQKSAYQRTLAIAQQPLVALQHLKAGTLIPQDIRTLQTVYPAYYQKMNEKLMASLTDHIAAGGKIPYRVRQSLSMFMAQPLDSTMTPQSIQSIQAIFAKNAAQRAAPNEAPQGQTKSNPSKLKKLAGNMQTPDQARLARRDAG